jgi:hypothetical protein
MMNWKRFVRNQTQLNHGTEGLMETTKSFGQDSRCPGRESNRKPAEYKSRAVTAILAFSVYIAFKPVTAREKEENFNNMIPSQSRRVKS